MDWVAHNAGRPRRRVVFLAAAVSLLVIVSPAEAQLFGGKGLFNREPEAPRIKSQDEIGVPTPVSGRVEVPKGREIQFEIKAHAKTPAASVEFLIRTFPSAGKILSLVTDPNRRNTAIVTYYADPGSGATSDAFAFAVRYRDGRYSSAARFDIDLVGEGSVGSGTSDIEVTESIDYGTVMVGDEEVREISIRNAGTGAFETVVLLSPPWHVVEPAGGKVSIPGRGYRQIEVAFRPELTGETSYYLSLSRSKKGTCLLKGSGEDPFTLISEAIELELDPESRERVGHIELENRSEKPILVGARASTRLQAGMEKEYILAPKKIARVEVALGRTDTAPFDGQVEFFLDNGYAKSAKVLAPVVPGEIEVTMPDSISNEVINFGQVEAGRTTERGFTLTNLGGVAVPLEFHVPEPFRLLNNPGRQLGPLSSVKVTMGMYPSASRSGLVDVSMNVFSNEQRIPIRLLGNVVRPEGAPRKEEADETISLLQAKGLRLSAGPRPTAPVETPESPAAAEPVSDTVDMPPRAPSRTGLPIGSRTRSPGIPNANDEDAPWDLGYSDEEAEKMLSPLGYVTVPMFEREINPELGSPEDLSVVATESDSLTIGWTAPKNSELCDFHVELRALTMSEVDQMPYSVWLPYARVKIDRIDRLVKAKVHGLKPKSVYEIRVVTVDPNGRSSEPSEAFTAETDMPMDWTYIYLTLGILFVVGLLLAVIKVVRDRRPEVYQAQFVDA